MSHNAINLKNDTYYIPFTRKATVQQDIKDVDTKIANYKNLIKDLQIEKKKKLLNYLMKDNKLYIFISIQRI